MKKLLNVLLFFCSLFCTLLAQNDAANVRPGLVEISRGDLVWDQPPVLPPHDCEEGEQSYPPKCPEPSGRPISYGRGLEDAVVRISPYGYVKWEGYYDTRQEIGFREEHTLLFPAPQLLDVFRQDINAHGTFTMTAFETRIGMRMKGPEWDGIKIDALVEGDFLGSFESSVFNFRLRNAFGRITWETGSFLYGQWWHPLWIPECFPHTIGYSAGAPLDPQARDPQLRLTQRWGGFELIAVAASQSDFASNGPLGMSPDYIRNAVVPNLHLQMRGYFGEHVVGVAGDYKRIAPRIVSDKCVKVNEFIDSFIGEAFAAFIVPPWSLRLKTFWAQNGADQLLISGYGVRTRDPETDVRTYSNTAAAGAWLDFSYLFHCDQMELGVFIGGTKNLGSRHSLYIDPCTGAPIIYALVDSSQRIDYAVEVIPRFIYMRDPFRVGVELQYSRASFGRPNRFGRVKHGCPVTDFRLYFALYYMF